ncbi:hypothetical protein GCM10011519_24500 [Marmoricola endophyticus]|uniref:Cutinase family protein n=1 Tax=Marmoricola endophyticus TaxID=2040280 RepID=A0A917BML7_9ACTN|nr:cutinase family protein [Marmoricola endophyticus]GGF49661.1 hypothetical protein GCM10011519_24500 [Marmoricola endophyticus]
MRPRAAALLVAVLLTAGCGSADLDRPRGAASPSADGCADLVVLGLRGQGQSASKAQGVGDEVLGVVRAIGARLPASQSLSLVAVRHPARLSPTQASYDADVATGVRMVQRHLDRLARRCPGSAVGLVGFSEGAQVVHLAAARTDHRLAFVALMGDPLRRPAGAGRELHLGTRVTGRGSNGAGPPFPARVRPYVVEACVAGDNVCNVPPTGRVGGVSETHRHVYERPATARAIAGAVHLPR